MMMSDVPVATCKVIRSTQVKQVGTVDVRCETRRVLIALACNKLTRYCHRYDRHRRRSHRTSDRNNSETVRGRGLVSTENQ